MSSNVQRSVAKALGKVGDLPTMPEVVAEVLVLTNDPDVAMGDVSAVIERDPGLSAKLLKVSNSSFYGMKQVVGTLKLALVILGVREVRNIALGVSVVESLRNRDTEILLTRSGLWNHSVLVGGLAKKLGSHFSMSMQGEDFIAGLLHDIGKMVLWRQLRKEYEPVFNASGGHSLPLCEAERKALGFDHADTAAFLAEKWNMPATLADALWCHHASEERPLENAKDPQLAALVRVANTAARERIGQGSDAECLSANDEQSWNIILSGHEPLSISSRRALVSGFVKELQAAPALVL